MAEESSHTKYTMCGGSHADTANATNSRKFFQHQQRELVALMSA